MATLQVLEAFVADRARTDWFVLDLCRHTGLGSGTVTEIVHRLQERGWLLSYWEAEEKAHFEGRPRRHYFRLTELGQQEALRELRQRFPSLAKGAGWSPQS